MSKCPKVPPALDQLFPSNPVFFVTASTYRRKALLGTYAVHAAFMQLLGALMTNTASLLADTYSCRITFTCLSAARMISN
ncbi:MAG: hypothetical protein ACJ8NS_13150 [Chthoniobacterales bacterium]